MTTTTLTLTEFLLARIAEDEAAHYRWQPSDRGDFDTPPSGCVPCGLLSGDCRVLAESKAKRQIVELHKPWYGRHECPICADGAGLDHGDAVVERLVAPCPTLRLLALPHADHPDYRPEWRP